jgi:antitoxin YefM
MLESPLGLEKELVMVITASEARAQLFPLIEKVNNDSTPIIITSKKGNAVLVSESEWESMIETMYLLRTPANRERLARSRADVAAGKLIEFTLPLSSASRVKNKVPKSKKVTTPTKGTKKVTNKKVSS